MSDTAKHAAAIERLATVHAEGFQKLASAIRHLGNADAATSMGGMEGLGFSIKNALETAGASIADAIRESSQSSAEGVSSSH